MSASLKIDIVRRHQRQVAGVSLLQQTSCSVASSSCRPHGHRRRHRGAASSIYRPVADRSRPERRSSKLHVRRLDLPVTHQLAERAEGAAGQTNHIFRHAPARSSSFTWCGCVASVEVSAGRQRHKVHVPLLAHCAMQTIGSRIRLHASVRAERRRSVDRDQADSQ